MAFLDWDTEPDWVSENESDGQTFYGYDDGDGHTFWYDKEGDLDSCTETPTDDECNDYLWRY